jgi:hypothetical protein
LLMRRASIGMTNWGGPNSRSLFLFGLTNKK